MSWLELLLHFQHKTGHLGVRCHNWGQNRQWKTIDATEDLSLRRMVASFGQYGNNILRHHDSSWRAIQRRPSNHRLHMWMNSIPVQIGDEVVQWVNGWLDLHGHVLRKSSDMDDIRLAT